MRKSPAGECVCCCEFPRTTTDNCLPDGGLPFSEGLGQRIRDSLARSKSRLVLDLNKLHWDKVDDLRPLREKLAAYRSRIRLIVPKLAAAHPEVVLLASAFELYKG